MIVDVSFWPVASTNCTYHCKRHVVHLIGSSCNWRDLGTASCLVIWKSHHLNQLDTWLSTVVHACWKVMEKFVKENLVKAQVFKPYHGHTIICWPAEHISCTASRLADGCEEDWCVTMSNAMCAKNA